VVRVDNTGAQVVRDGRKVENPCLKTIFFKLGHIYSLNQAGWNVGVLHAVFEKTLI